MIIIYYAFSQSHLVSQSITEQSESLGSTINSSCLKEAMLHIDLPETIIGLADQRNFNEHANKENISDERILRRRSSLSNNEERLLLSRFHEFIKQLCARWVFGEKARAGEDARFVTHLSSQEAESPSFYLRLGALCIYTPI